MKQKQKLIFFLLLIFSLYSFNINAQTILSNVAKGSQFMQDGDYRKATYYYQLALNDDSRNTDALYQLAKIAHIKEDYGRSLDYLNRLLAVNNIYGDALVLRSKIYIKQNKLNGAINDLKLAELNDANNLIIQMLLENTYSLLKNSNLAQKHATNYKRLRALEINKEIYKP